MAHAVIPEEELKPIVDSMKKVFSPIFKIGPAVIKIPQELKRIGDNLREDVSSGIPERFERACDKLEDTNEKFVMDFGGKVLEQAKESRDIANQQVERLLKEGIPAVVTETNEVRILTEKEVQLLELFLNSNKPLSKDFILKVITSCPAYRHPCRPCRPYQALQEQMTYLQVCQ